MKGSKTKTLVKTRQKLEKTKKKEVKEETKNVPTVLYEIASSKIEELVISQENTNDVYAIVKINGHSETINLDSSRAKHWLTSLDTGVHSQQMYENVLQKIISRAQIQGARKAAIHNRIAYENDILYYDLARPDGRIVKVSESGIEIVDYQPKMPLFMRSQSAHQQVVPSYDDPQALDKLANLLQIQGKQLFLVNLVSQFLPHIPVPIMAFTGGAGTFKSVITATVKMIVDPAGESMDDNITKMKKEEDLVLQLYHSYFLPFNNVSHINRDQSDILCTAITGGGNQKRKLYTDQEQIIMNFKRKAAINGVTPNFGGTDLEDRILGHDRNLLAKKKSEDELLSTLHKLLPCIFGKILETLREAMIMYKQVKNEVNIQTRLSDFEIWGECISRALGNSPNTFLEIFYNKRNVMALESVESEPVIKTIIELLKDRSHYEGSATETLEKLEEIKSNIFSSTSSGYFPQSASALTSKLRELRTVLNKIGLDFQQYNYTKSDGQYPKNTSILRLSKIKGGEDGEDSFSSFKPREEKENMKELMKKIDYFSITI